MRKCLRLSVIGSVFNFLDDPECLGIKYLCLVIFEQKEKQFRIAMFDVNAVADVRLRLLGRFLQAFSDRLLESLDSHAVEECFIDHLSTQPFMVEELQKLLPVDLLLVFAIQFIDQVVNARLVDGWILLLINHFTF